MFIFPIVIANIEDDGDREFMEQLYLEHHAMMHRLARKFAKNVYDVDDIISEACIALINKIDLLKTLPPNERLGYVNATTRNTGLRFCQSRYKRHEIPDDGDFLSRNESLSPEPDAAILEEITVLDIRAALNELSAADNELLTMKYILEMSDADIAGVLDINPGALRTRLSRARRRLYDVYSTRTGV